MVDASTSQRRIALYYRIVTLHGVSNEKRACKYLNSGSCIFGERTLLRLVIRAAMSHVHSHSIRGNTCAECMPTHRGVR